MTALRRTISRDLPVYGILSTIRSSTPSCLKSRSLVQCSHVGRSAAAPRAYATASLTNHSQLPKRISTHHQTRASSSSTSPASSETQPTSSPEPPDYLSATELTIFLKLRSELQPIRLEVQDISGGCGSMFGLDIVSSAFEGKSVIKQHQMVNRVLKEEIRGWHGMQLKTKAPGG